MEVITSYEEEKFQT